MDIVVRKRDCKLISTYTDWRYKQDSNFDENAEWGEREEKEFDLVTEILSLDGAHWLFRQISGGVFDGCHTDTINAIRRRAINRYDEVMGIEYVDFNAEEIW